MKKLKSLVAVLMAMAFMLLLAGCGDDEEKEEEVALTNEYLYHVIATVPKGETYNENGLNMSVESAKVKGGSAAYNIIWKCKMSMSHDYIDAIKNFVYEDGKHVSYYSSAPDVESRLVREDDYHLDVVTGYGDMYGGGYSVTVWEEDSEDISLDSAKYTVEVHPTWDGWPQDQSVVFELN